MKKYHSIILSIFILLSIITGALIWTQAFYKAITHYHFSVQSLEPPTQPPVSSQTTKVVIVLVSGLGYETSQLLGLPVFEQLARVGASTIIQSFPPTYSQTAWLTLVTGAPADVNGAPPIDQSFETLLPSPVDTIFARAGEANLKTALLGRGEWRYLIDEDELSEAFFVDAPGPESDQAILQAALPLLKDNEINLVLVQFTALELAAKRQGGISSNNYRSAATAIDSYLGQISRSLDLNNTVLMILSDHGFISPGGHGGDEIEVTQQPLIVIGKDIIPGSYTDVRQIDIAPTVTTLLGTTPPSSAHGRILFEMINLEEQNRTAAQLVAAQQRVILAEAYLAQVKGSAETLPERLFDDLARAKAALAQNNLSGAFQLALLTQEAADVELSATKHSRVQSEQWSRLPVAGIILLIWSMMMWRRRGRHASLIIVATLVTVGLYHTLFQLQGYHYSISSLNNFNQLPFDIARRIVVSLLAGGALILIFLMLVNEENWLILLGTGYGFSLFVTCLFALPLVLTFWQNGFTVDWYLPPVGLVFWQIMGLLEVIITATIGLLLPWPIMLLNVFVNWVRHNLSDSSSQSGRDTLPGLRL